MIDKELLERHNRAIRSLELLNLSLRGLLSKDVSEEDLKRYIEEGGSVKELQKKKSKWNFLKFWHGKKS